MKVLECKFLQDFVKMAEDGYQQGWHERNGGNLSYRLKKGEVDAIRQRLSETASWQPIGTSVPGLAEGGNPTSELPTHLMNHEIKKKLTGGKHRVIYHAHTTNTIALTFVLPLNDEVFTRELWEMATECPVVFPEGVGVVGWMVPGGRDIAVATSKLMEQYNAVIWAHHGMFCSGEDFDLTFGLMHTIEKSAEILIKVMSMVPQKRQTIEPDDFRALAKGFNVELSERFLYDKRSLSI